MFKRPLMIAAAAAVSMSRGAGAVTAAKADPFAANIGWRPPVWRRSGSSSSYGRKPKGRRHTPNPAAQRRKARSLAKRKAA